VLVKIDIFRNGSVMFHNVP